VVVVGGDCGGDGSGDGGGDGGGVLMLAGAVFSLRQFFFRFSSLFA
jgi:hypothetical protein